MDNRNAMDVIQELDRYPSGPFALTVFDEGEVDFQTENLRCVFSLLQEMDNYLDGYRENYIGHGSKLHMKIKRELESYKS